MKFIKKMSDFKNQKVMFGLFAVLFMGSIVQTGAILKSQSSNQAAQVTVANTNCLQVTPKYNYTSVNNNIAITDQSSEFNNIINIQFKVKNVCSYNIYVVSPQTINRVATPDFSHSYTSLQRLGWQNMPETITTLGEYFPQPVNDFAEIMSAQSVGQVFTTSAPDVSTHSTQQVTSYRISPNQTRDFTLMNVLPFNYNFGPTLRLTIGSLKWSNQTAIQDNLIVPKEVKTYSLPTSLQDSIATDFLTIYNGCDCENNEGVKSLELDNLTTPNEKSPAIAPSSSPM